MQKGSNSRYLFLLLFILFIGGGAVLAKSVWFTPKTLTGVTPIKTETPSRGEPASIGVLTDAETDFAFDSSVYSGESIQVISNFEGGEANEWQGNGVIDEKVFFEGSQSLGIVSTDRRSATVILEKNLDLSQMQFIEFMFHVADAETYESVYIDFADSELKSYYRYGLTNLKNGWNLIQIPKDKFIQYKPKDVEFGWSDIEKVRFTTLSRPSSIFLARLDMIRSVVNSEAYLQHWRGSNIENFISLVSESGEPKLLARNMGANTAVLKAIEDINDFTFVASVSPQSTGRSGLFIRGNYNNGYGYYFLIGGDKRNTWEIQKRNRTGWIPTAEKVSGVLQNVVFSSDKKYWLRVDAKGDTMEFYFSFDGEKFEKFGEIQDDEFRGGGVGITSFDTGSWSLFDDFQFKRY